MCCVLLIGTTSVVIILLPSILTNGFPVKSIKPSENLPGPTETKNLLLLEEPVIESTADLIDVKSPPFLATVIILGS